MDLQHFWELLYQNITDTSIIEVIAVIFGIASVVYSKKVNILVYPTGLVSVIIYVYICFFAKLYADMGINVVYFIMSIYGWYIWSRKGVNKKVRPISMCSRKENILNIIMFIGFFFILIYVLKNFTDSDVPVWDSLTTAIFIVGMWLMAMKKVENWILWIIGDLISIPLYFHKGLVLTSVQFIVFLALAILGYLEWKKKYEALKDA
jgi:nicotinamide mononucleotide transporter